MTYPHYIGGGHLHANLKSKIFMGNFQGSGLQPGETSIDFDFFRDQQSLCCVLSDHEQSDRFVSCIEVLKPLEC